MGDLRGCIGGLEGHQPLVDGVVENARHAAFHDTRFLPLEGTELGEIAIEVSLLTPPEPLLFHGMADLKNKIEPGVHGVIIEKGHARATFLPQVWEQLETVDAFMDYLCQKAGLSPRVWRQGKGFSLHTYTVQYFKEKGFRG